MDRYRRCGTPGLNTIARLNGISEYAIKAARRLCRIVMYASTFSAVYKLTYSCCVQLLATCAACVVLSD